MAAITDWPAELVRLAKEEETAVLAKADEIFAECAAEHERQTAGYSFECRRFGDFLTVFVERAANEADWMREEPERKVSTSLNIGKTKEVRLTEGRCFDRRGTVSYWADVTDDKGSSSGWGTGYGHGAPGKGWRYRAHANLPYIKKSRPMVRLDKKDDKDWERGFGEQAIRYTTENFPRPAQDDKIRFEGIGATIYAPAGKGRAVYDAILNEIALNTPAAVLPEVAI